MSRLLIAVALALTSVASAQSEDSQDNRDIRPGRELPAPQSSDETPPPVARPDIPAEGVIRQAGVGSPTAFGRPGVLELGGAAGLTSAAGLTQLTLSPSLGYFFAENFQITGILGLTYVSAENADGILFRLLAEPSYHLPFTQEFFGFLGVGLGVAAVENRGFGFALAPRLGANFLVGRSGILTPSVAWQYTTHGTAQNPGATDSALVAVTSALVATVGYTVMW